MKPAAPIVARKETRVHGNVIVDTILLLGSFVLVLLLIGTVIRDRKARSEARAQARIRTEQTRATRRGGRIS